MQNLLKVKNWTPKETPSICLFRAKWQCLTRAPPPIHVISTSLAIPCHSFLYHRNLQISGYWLVLKPSGSVKVLWQCLGLTNGHLARALLPQTWRHGVFCDGSTKEKSGCTREVSIRGSWGRLTQALTFCPEWARWHCLFNISLIKVHADMG